MSHALIVDLARNAIMLALLVAGPMLIVALLIGLTVSVLQAVTQIQDQSIGQSVRLIAVMLTIVVSAGWLGRDVMRFAERAMTTVARLT